MTRMSESGQPHGGIGTMLLQSEVCPACGKAHKSRLTRYLPAVANPIAPSAAVSHLAFPDAPNVATHPRARRSGHLPIPMPSRGVSEELL